MRRLLLVGHGGTGNGGATTCTIEVAYDYVDTYTTQVNATTIAANAAFQIRTGLAQQKCEAVKFRVTLAGATDVPDVVLSDLTLEVGMKQGTAKLSNAKTV